VWEEAGEPGENPQMHREDMQITERSRDFIEEEKKVLLL